MIMAEDCRECDDYIDRECVCKDCPIAQDLKCERLKEERDET